MSDYMFMLESHLNGDHNRVVNVVTELANEANVNLYLAGGAVRAGAPSAPRRAMP